MFPSIIREVHAVQQAYRVLHGIKEKLICPCWFVKKGEWTVWSNLAHSMVSSFHLEIGQQVRKLIRHTAQHLLSFGALFARSTKGLSSHPRDCLDQLPPALFHGYEIRISSHPSYSTDRLPSTPTGLLNQASSTTFRAAYVKHGENQLSKYWNSFTSPSLSYTYLNILLGFFRISPAVVFKFARL